LDFGGAEQGLIVVCYEHGKGASGSTNNI
jgi:hypothetical protein